MPMLSRLRSLRVRITLFATLAVTAALVVAALGLVLTVERSLFGRLKTAAIDQLDVVADAVEAGRDPNVGVTEPPDVLVQILDQEGNLVGSVPRGALFTIGCGSDCPSTFETPVDPDGAPLPDIVQAPVGGGTIVQRLDTAELILAQRTVDSPEGERTIVAISPFSGVSRSLDTVVTALWIGTPFLIAVVASVSWHFTGRTLRPVGAIARRAEEISHSTIGDRLPRTGTDDEVDRLVATLNSMLERLDASARRQREFVSDASHELRSPIAAIRAQLEVALAHPEGSSWVNVATDGLAETERLERLVGDLLALAKAEELGTQRDLVDLGEIVETEVERCADERVAVELTRMMVEGDAGQLERAFANLLDNARRFATDRIDVAVRRSKGAVVLSVDDDGPGIAEADQQRVFERFTRLQDGRTRNDGGVGIGLALVARVVEGHHGVVSCSRSSLGGTRFEVRLPGVQGRA